MRKRGKYRENECEKGKWRAKRNRENDQRAERQKKVQKRKICEVTGNWAYKCELVSRGRIDRRQSHREADQCRDTLSFCGGTL